MGKEDVKELLLMVCKHVIKKSVPPLPSNYPHVFCKVCTNRMGDADIKPEEAVKDVILLCPDCLSKDIRDKPFWKDWYKIALKHYQSMGYDSLPCTDSEVLRTEPPTLQDCDCAVCNEDINKVEDPGKPDQFGCYIKQFFHCKKCMNQKPEDKSAAEWARINVGFTAKGLEVWCVRCNISIIHLDFQGSKPIMI